MEQLLNRFDCTISHRSWWQNRRSVYLNRFCGITLVGYKQNLRVYDTNISSRIKDMFQSVQTFFDKFSINSAYFQWPVNWMTEIFSLNPLLLLFQQDLFTTDLQPIYNVYEHCNSIWKTHLICEIFWFKKD